MTLYRLLSDSVEPIPQTSLQHHGVWERSDLQRILRDRIEVLLPDTLVLAEEFRNWSDSSRRIDLLCLAQDGALIVVELKRGDTGSHMDLQALRYAAMVSPMTFEDAVDVHERFLRRMGHEPDAQQRILTFLGWNEPDEGHFAQDVRIVLVSEDFSAELTTAVLWLNERELDIRCIRLRSYEHAGEHLIQVEPIIPLREAGDYQIKMRAKDQEVRRARTPSREPAPELLAVSEAYRLIADSEFPLVGSAWNYRQIKPTHWQNLGAIHYEFYRYSGNRIDAELHLEDDRVREVAEVLRPLDGERLEGVNVTLRWDPGWRAGRGRLTCGLSAEAPAELVAEAMQALIARTFQAVTRKLEALETEAGGRE